MVLKAHETALKTQNSKEQKLLKSVISSCMLVELNRDEIWHFFYILFVQFCQERTGRDQKQGCISLCQDGFGANE